MRTRAATAPRAGDREAGRRRAPDRRAHRAGGPARTCRSTARGPRRRRPLRRELRLRHVGHHDDEGLVMSDTHKDGLGVVGVGVAACVACCAAPTLTFLGGLSVAGVASTMLIGTAGFLVAAVALAALLVIRRRRPACAVPDPASTPVAAPARRTAGSTR